MDLWDESMNLLGKLNRLENNPKDFDSSNLKLGIVELNVDYQRLLEKAESKKDFATLSILKLYDDRRKEFLEYR